jgi:hypothetical protein
MDLAIFGSETSALADIARTIYWLCKLETNRETQKRALTGGGERHGWNPPRRQSAKVRAQRLERWKQYQLKKLESQLTTLAKIDPKWLEKLKREFIRIRNEDATVFLFDAPSITKSKTNNPSWFRQFLIANIGLKSLLGRESFPLLQIANQIKVPVRTLRREERRMGINPRKAGTPKRRKPAPLI